MMVENQFKVKPINWVFVLAFQIQQHIAGKYIFLTQFKNKIYLFSLVRNKKICVNASQILDLESIL